MGHLLVLRISRIAILILAGMVVYLALRSYHRGDGKVMLYLSAGFSLIALGALTSGLLFELLHLELALTYTIESFMSAIGLAIIVYSIYGVRE